MKRVNKHHGSKRGASSVFLALIMSALILVECTFVAFVWNLDYALSVNTALKTQVDTILCDYNRQLFDVYGIYAFSLDQVDDECFDRALESNGLDSRSVLYVSFASRFTTEDLRKAINSYYWYRGTGISAKSLIEGYSKLFAELDEKGVMKKVGEFMNSPAAGYLSQIIKGSDSIEEWIGKAGDVLNADDIIKEADDIDSIRDGYKNLVKDIEIDVDFDIADWEELLDTVSLLEDTMEDVSGSTDAVLSKINISHYCAFNFDCWCPPDGDASITGTKFENIHGKKRSDAEYIITGLEGVPGRLLIEHLIFQVLIVSNMLKDYADEKFRNTMEVLGEIISAIILAISEGTVDIDPKLIALGLTYYCAIVQAGNELYVVTHGKRVVIFGYEEVDMITYSYRDFLNLFCLLTPEADLLERAREVLTTDYGKMYKGIRLEADFRGETYYVEKSYQLYE